ncbi:MAG: GNAT family N-acetyltransferase [Alphaproteobacteria bacterium]
MTVVPAEICPEIRTVGLASAELLAALHGASFAGSAAEAWSADSVRSLLQTPGMLALIATSQATAPAPDPAGDPQPCGLAVARCGPDDAEILALGVLPHVQRRGIATRLLAAMQQLFVAADIRKILLEVAVDNQPARRLYAAQGFREVGLRRGYYQHRPGLSIDALVLARPVCLVESANPDSDPA